MLISHQHCLPAPTRLSSNCLELALPGNPSERELLPLTGALRTQAGRLTELLTLINAARYRRDIVRRNASLPNGVAYADPAWRWSLASGLAGALHLDHAVRAFTTKEFWTTADIIPAIPGAYVLAIELAVSLCGKTSALLPPGLYLYCGSAKGPWRP